MMTLTAEFILFTLLAVATFSAVGLVAIWGGLGRSHWFLRLAVVVAVIALPLAIPAYELVLLFSLQSALTILPLMVLRRFRARAATNGKDSEDEQPAIALGRAQFFLRDLLLLTAIAAPIFSIVAVIPRETWANWRPLGLYGMFLGLMTLAGAAIGLERRRAWLRLILACLLFPATLIAGWLGFARAAGLIHGGSPKHAPIKRMAQVATVMLGLLIVLPPLAVYYKLLNPRPIPPTQIPNPNGYLDIIRAAESLANVAVPDDSQRQALKAFVVQYSPALDAARAGLRLPCVVPLQYDSAEFYLAPVQLTRKLARALAAEAKLARAEGRTADAARTYLDAFRLGAASARGGLVIHDLVGWAVQYIGEAGLSELRNSLSAAQCREILRALQEMDGQREPVETILARDFAWHDRAGNWLERIRWLIERIASPPRLPPGSMCQSARKRHQTHVQLLLGELALRAYSLDHGKPPTTLGDLVPEYLPRVPEDVYSGNPLIYRQTPKGYLLYSVGADGRDDGGVVGGITDGDLLLDELIE